MSFGQWEEQRALFSLKDGYVDTNACRSRQMGRKMNRNNLPLVLMLVAGAVTCVINLIRQYPMPGQLVVLFIVLVVFYLLGNVIKWTLDFFDSQNEKKAAEEGEVIEKESEQSEQEVKDSKPEQDN